MAQGLDSTKIPGTKTGVDKTEEETLDRDAMKGAKRGLKEMHEDEKPSIPGDSIFTK